MKNNLLLIILLVNLPVFVFAMVPSLLFVNKEGIVTKGNPFAVASKKADPFVGRLVYDAFPVNGKALVAVALYNVDDTRESQSFYYSVDNKHIKVTIIPHVLQNRVLSYCIKQQVLPIK